MPKFPTTEAGLLALAQSIIAGLTANPNFPSPPVSNEALDTLRTAAVRASEAVQAAEAALQQAYDAKEQAFSALDDAVRSDIAYAKAVCGNNDSKLKQIGWGSRAPAMPMTPPGLCGVLKGERQGEGTIVLRWSRPKEGGRPEGYQIERRLRSNGSWELVGNAFVTTKVLSGQPRNQELEYRVVAGNRAGDGTPSNIVVALL
jgi:hypothetical protein